MAEQAAKMRKIRAKWTPEKKEEIRQKRVDAKPTMLMQAARQRCSKSGMEFDLDDEWVAQRWTGRCELTGFEFAIGNRVLGMFSPSIDRVDNSRGYLKDNCRFILFGLNTAKGAGTDAELLQIAQAVVARGRLNVAV
ncbi:MAG: hypothetical protein LLG14_27255 [Nocardiaceae bacterium]|nr:hypothetical protein [Nocardiaceae bacterium]